VASTTEGNDVRVLVTGGAGFIGTNLVTALTRCHETAEVTVLDDLSSGSRANVPTDEGVRFVEASVLDDRALRRASRGVDVIVHLAARPSVARSMREPLATHDANATGTLRVLEAARAVGDAQVIVASSSSVYGANPLLPKHEELRPVPLSPYAVSKLTAETYTLAYGHCFDLPVLAFRFFNVFGPHQPADHAYAAVVPAFLDAALASRPLPLDGDGGQTRDFTYVGTLVDVVVEAARRRVVSPEPVNLAFGTRRSILDVAELVAMAVGCPLEFDRRPTRPGDVRHSQADGTRLRALFPDVSAVPFEVGLARTLTWFRHHVDATVGASAPGAAAALAAAAIPSSSW
jgi:UDP-glucose 4-epimerase